MRILINGINYLPELTGVGKYTGDMAEWLADQGHDVTVVTAPPYYPEWRVWQGYSAWKYTREKIGKVKVFRCPIWVPQKPSGKKRILHLISFAASCLPVMLWQAVSWKPDVVWAVAPDFFCAPGAWLASRLCGARAWLHMQDFEVDTVFNLGILRAGKIKSIVKTLERCLVRRYDRISTISENMVARLKVKGVDESKLVLFPNWVDTESIKPLCGQSPMKDELGIEAKTVVALYSGNMGEKQGLEILVDAARILTDHKDIVFILCGDGAVRRRLKSLAEGLLNIRFLPLQPIDRLSDLLNLADIHLCPQRAGAEDLVMPSKLTGMLASGRPVVANANEGTQVARVVERCGIVVQPEEDKVFAEAILELAKDQERRFQLGQIARSIAVSNMSREKILRQFENELISSFE